MSMIIQYNSYSLISRMIFIDYKESSIFTRDYQSSIKNDEGWNKKNLIYSFNPLFGKFSNKILLKK